MTDYYEVIPDPPVFDDAGMRVVLPEHEGVVYDVAGVPADGVEVTVTATADDGWVLFGDGPFSWSHVFVEPVPDDPGPEVPVPDPNEGYGGAWDPGHGDYLSRNAGRRESLLEAARQIASLTDVDDAVGTVADEVHNLGTVVADYGDALERKVEPWAVPTVAPLSQTINRRADPTFGLSDFFIPRLDLSGNTQGADGHFHALTGDYVNAGRVEQSLQGGADTKGRAYFAFITPAINRAYEQLNFMVGDVTSPCQMDVAVYVVDEDTKILHQQVYVEDALASHGIGESVVTVTFPTWVATQGSYVAVAFLQHGSGNTRQLLGLNETPRPLMNNVFPRKISAIHTTVDRVRLPDPSNGETNLDFNYWFNPYAELSENVGIDYRAFTEGWPDEGYERGRPWVPLTSQGIASGGGYTAAFGSGLRVSMYDTPLSTDYARVRSSIYRDSSSGTTRRSTLIVRGTNDLRSGVGLSAISRTRYELIQWNNLAVTSDEEWNDRTVVRTINLAPQVGDQIEIDYLDGLVTVRINGVEHIAGQSVGGPTGAAGRFLGIQNRRQAFITGSWSPWFGPWSARDLPQDTGGDTGEEGEEG